LIKKSPQYAGFWGRKAEQKSGLLPAFHLENQ
jgi:hypothetical protein